jgi:hypothetical protein
VVDEQEVQTSRGEAPAGKCIKRASTIADRADHTGDTVGDVRVQPDPSSYLGVCFR